MARLMIGTKEPVNQIENRQTGRHRASPTTGNRTHVAFRVGLPGFNERVLATGVADDDDAGGETSELEPSHAMAIFR